MKFKLWISEAVRYEHTIVIDVPDEIGEQGLINALEGIEDDCDCLDELDNRISRIKGLKVVDRISGYESGDLDEIEITDILPVSKEGRP